MTFGGSLFPGALGAMLIEILPFLQGIGSDIQRDLGDDSPALVPTVMVAYALTSFLIGFVFLVLGVLKAGFLVCFGISHETVVIQVNTLTSLLMNLRLSGRLFSLTGVIGGIGVSLFVLGLALPFPPSSPPLTFSSVGSELFGFGHLGLLFASCGPALFLSFSIRSDFIRRWTYGKSQHAYYIPLYFVFIPIIFWVTVICLQRTNGAGRDTLVNSGWLFDVDLPNKGAADIGLDWVYWTLFDFTSVEIYALKAAVTNIVLLVVIGVLNLPIYVPALGSSLGVSVNMNHEFIGQGIANVLAGLAGTVPNILVS